MDKMFTLGVILSASDMLSPVMGKANKSVGDLETKIEAASKSMAKIGTTYYVAGRAMLTPVMDTIGAYQDLRAAQGEIESLGIGANGIDAITKSAKEFSNQFAGTTGSDFVKASYDIKSGISTLSDVAVGEFTKMAAMTGAATKSTTAEMTKLFALGHGIFRKDFGDDVQFATQFSAAISGAVQAFRTDGADISLGLSNIGAAASSMGVTLQEELSIIGVAKSSFNSASEAATGYRAFLDNVGKAQKDLGLEFTDSNGKMLPMIDILTMIQDKFGDLSVLENSDALKNAFGSAEAVKLIKGLIDKREDLSQAQKTLNGHMANGTKLTLEMALAMNKGKEFDIMNQQLANLSSTAGQMFAPVISKVAVVVGDLTSGLQSWIEENRTTATVIGYTVAGLGALLTVAGSILIPISAIGFALPAFAAGFTAVSGAVGFMGTVLTTVGRAMLMNPIGLVITAIALGAYLIYRNWEPISNFFGRVWDGIKIVFSEGFGFVKNLFLNFTPLGQVIKNWEPISNFFSSMIDSLSSMFSGYFDWVIGKFETVGSIFSTVKGWFGGDEQTAIKTVSKIEAVPAKQISGVSDTKSVRTTAAATAEAVTRNSTNSSSVKIDKVEINNPKSDVDVERAMARAMERNRNRSYSDEEV